MGDITIHWVLNITIKIIVLVILLRIWDVYAYPYMNDIKVIGQMIMNVGVYKIIPYSVWNFAVKIIILYSTIRFFIWLAFLFPPK